MNFDEWADKAGYGLNSLKSAPRFDAFQGWQAATAEKESELRAAVEQAHVEAISAVADMAENRAYNAFANTLRETLTPRVAHLKAELRVLEARWKEHRRMCAACLADKKKYHCKYGSEIEFAVTAKRTEIDAEVEL